MVDCSRYKVGIFGPNSLSARATNRNAALETLLHSHMNRKRDEKTYSGS